MTDRRQLIEQKGPIAYDNNIPVEEGDFWQPPPGEFSQILGFLPFKRPNVRIGHEQEDLGRVINGDSILDSFGGMCKCACAFTGIGACWLLSKMYLIEEGQLGFSQDNGKPKIYFPGRYFLASPLNEYQNTYSWGNDRIESGPVSIIRVPEGKLGFSMNNSIPEILLPGVHVRKTTAFKYSDAIPTDQDLIQYGPIKIFIVKSGEVRVCYDKGKVQIFHEGRYAVNNAAFRVANTINTQQQNMRFAKHPVLLDGGIGLLVEGLLTFKVVDVERLIKELGDRDLARSIEDTSKAEISRVFAGIHLEQISTATVGNKRLVPEHKANAAVLGAMESIPGSEEGEERSKICGKIIQYITPICSTWGVQVINFQLESTKIADVQYAKEYEQASLGMAKAKANLRSVDAENDILVRRAQARARSVQIEAEGKRDATVILASGEGDARKIEATSRNEAANYMTDDFAKRYAMAGQQVEFAGALKANVLTVLPDSAVGKPLLPMFNLPK